MEAKLMATLGVSKVKRTGFSGGGCINEGSAYETDKGLVFVKTNAKPKARIMFDGELEGLNAILATNTVRIPKPISVMDDGSGGAALVMEFINMSPLTNHSERLGEHLAKLHLHNESLKNKSASIHKTSEEANGIQQSEYVEEFGFHISTCCGYIPQENSWKKDWVEFFAQQRLHHQLQLVETEYSDREAAELWSQLQIKIPQFFQGLTITPALLHGDLWSGNAAQAEDGPVIFDPAVFYGHSEYELAIAEMFGGFSNSFYRSYHSLLPKMPGFEKRRDLYKLFHCLNHWNHFGGGYRSSSISIMKRLLKDIVQ